MINLHRKEKTRGAATLLITVILLTAAVLIMLFASHFSALEQKTASNQYTNDQAYEAAEAGLEFAIPYLNQNGATIIASPVNGFIIYGPANSAITNVALANGSKYSIVYTNPTANNFDLIQITSTGVSADGTATRVVKQQVQKRPLANGAPINPLSLIGAASLGGNSKVINLNSNVTIRSGSTVTIRGSATTTAQSGGSSAGSVGPDVQQNLGAYQGITPDQFFMTFFGSTASTIENSVQIFYPSTSTTNYGTALDGLLNTSVWIDQPVSMHANPTIGSQTQPVLLIINGDFTVSGSPTINGLVYVTGNASFGTGTPQINGALITTGTTNFLGNVQLTFDPIIMTNLKLNTGTAPYVKVPGSWRDF